MEATKLADLSYSRFLDMLHNAVGSVPAVNWWMAGFNSAGTAARRCHFELYSFLSEVRGGPERKPHVP